MVRGVRHHGGGIGELCRLADEHGGALEYDLMTRAAAILDDVPARIPWTALRSFVTHLDASSALSRELYPETAGWQGTERVPMILADLYDLVGQFAYGYAVSHTQKGKRRPSKPEPYPRPGAKKREPQRIGRGAIPISEFDRWWNGG